MSQNLNTPYWNSAWSATAAFTEVLFPGQLLFHLKNHAQLKRQNPALRLESNPLKWYRGFSANAGGIVPSTIMQMIVADVAARHLFGKSENLSVNEKAACAALSGAIVSFYQGPAELLSMRQGAWKVSALAAARRVHSEYGFATLFRGVECTIPREIKFTLAYQVAGPTTRDMLEKQYGFSSASASLLGYGSAGVAGAGLSHFWDTLKTVRQNDLDPKNRLSLGKSFSHVWKKGAFDGLMWRTFRVIGAIAIYDLVGQRAKRWTEERLS